MGGYESWIDRQIRQAQKRGEFDDLPGSGKPIPNRNELHDENWWIKQWVQREQITGLVPASLRIRKEAEELLPTVAAQRDEGRVRQIVVDLNERIERARRSQVDGPPVYLEPFDVDEVLAAWRAARRPSATDGSELRDAEAGRRQSETRCWSWLRRRGR